jgi:toxin-antitoxin system PIN domain toxin
VLLDVNLLVSLAWPNHVHHAAARRWFDKQCKGRRWATTPVTEAGFVRVSSNRAAIPTAVTPYEATQLLDRLCRVGGHQFVVDDVALVFGDKGDAGRVVTYHQVTDAHLVAVARHHGLSLATFDRGVPAVAGADSVVLVPFN